MVYNFNVKFYNGPVTIDTIQNEYLLLYVIRGSCHVHLASETLHMNPKDVLMINGNRHFKLQDQPCWLRHISSLRLQQEELKHVLLP